MKEETMIELVYDLVRETIARVLVEEIVNRAAITAFTNEGKCKPNQIAHTVSADLDKGSQISEEKTFPENESENTLKKSHKSESQPQGGVVDLSQPDECVHGSSGDAIPVNTNVSSEKSKDIDLVETYTENVDLTSLSREFCHEPGSNGWKISSLAKDEIIIHSHSISNPGSPKCIEEMPQEAPRETLASSWNTSNETAINGSSVTGGRPHSDLHYTKTIELTSTKNDNESCGKCTHKTLDATITSEVFEECPSSDDTIFCEEDESSPILLSHDDADQQSTSSSQEISSDRGERRVSAWRRLSYVFSRLGKTKRPTRKGKKSVVRRSFAAVRKFFSR